MQEETVNQRERKRGDGMDGKSNGEDGTGQGEREKKGGKREREDGRGRAGENRGEKTGQGSGRRDGKTGQGSGRRGRLDQNDGETGEKNEEQNGGQNKTGLGKSTGAERSVEARNEIHVK